MFSVQCVARDRPGRLGLGWPIHDPVGYPPQEERGPEEQEFYPIVGPVVLRISPGEWTAGTRESRRCLLVVTVSSESRSVESGGRRGWVVSYGEGQGCPDAFETFATPPATVCQDPPQTRPKLHTGTEPKDFTRVVRT